MITRRDINLWKKIFLACFLFLVAIRYYLMFAGIEISIPYFDPLFDLFNAFILWILAQVREFLTW